MTYLFIPVTAVGHSRCVAERAATLLQLCTRETVQYAIRVATVLLSIYIDVARANACGKNYDFALNILYFPAKVLL